MESNIKNTKEEFKNLTNYDLATLKMRTQEDICESSGIYKEKFVQQLKRIEHELKRRAEERLKANQLV